MNVPRGLYRNHLGVELHVVAIATPSTGVPTIGGDIAIAEERGDLFVTRRHLVTEASLKGCGYKLVEVTS